MSAATNPSAMHFNILSALNQLIVGLDMADMAAIFARHMLGGGQRLAVNVLRFDTRDQRQSWEPLETINQERAANRTTRLDIPWEDLTDRLRSILESGEMVVAEDAPEEPALIAWMRDHQFTTFAIFPVLMANHLNAVMTVFGQPDDPFTPEALSGYSAVANQIGVLLHIRHLLDTTRTARNIIDNLALANRLITSAEDYPYMAQAVTYTLARNMLAVSLTLFDRPLDEGEVPLYRRLVGLSTQDDVITVDRHLIHPNFLPNEVRVAKLRGSLPLVARDIKLGESYLPPVLYELGGSDMLWMGSFGLRSGEQLLGTLDIINNTPYTFSQEELDGYTTLADHIGVSIVSRQLLEASQLAQHLSQQMVETNRLISIAEDHGAMAKALFYALPSGIAMTGILLFDDPVVQRDTPDMLRTAILATRDSVTEVEVNDTLGPDIHELAPDYNRLLEGELVVVEDTRRQEVAILPNLIRYLQVQGLNSFAAIGMRSGLRLLGIIIFAAEDLISLGGMQLDNLRTIAGQVAIAIENRSLLDQTNEALGFVAGQYEISSVLYKAEAPGEMLKALYRFLDRLYANAYLGIIDLDIDQKPVGTMRVIAEIIDGRFEESEPEGALRVLELPGFVGEPDTSPMIEEPKALILPLVTRARQALGVIRFDNPEPVALAFNRRRALRNLADQLTITLENRFLLMQTASTLQETRTLYDINRALLLSQDSLDMLRLVRDTIAGEAICLVLVALTHQFMTDRVEEYVVDSILTEKTAQRVKFRLHESLDTGVLNTFKVRWQERSFDPLFIEDVNDWDTPDPILNYLREQWIDVRAMVIVPILDDDLLANQICIAFDKPRTFDETTRRLFRSLRDQTTIILQNQRLLRDVSASAAQLGNQVRVLQTLNQLAANLNNTQDERILMEDSAQALVNALRLDHAMLVLINPDGSSATVVGEYPPGDLLNTRLDVNDLLQTEVRRFRNPVHISSISGHPEISETLRKGFEDLNLKSTTLIPLVDLRDQYIGLASLASETAGRTLTSENLDVARTITAQTIASYQNVRQLRNTQAQARQLQQLADFSQSIQSRLDVPSILDTVAVETPLILQLDHLEVLLYDSVSEKLYLAAEYDSSKGGKLTFDTVVSATIGGYESVPGRLVTLDGTTAERAWFSRSPLHIRDVARETNLRHTLRPELRSALVELIFSRGVALGVVEIASKAASAYSETDIVIFKQVVNQIGIAIENAQAYMQSQRVARSKALVNEISTQLQRQVDIDSILNVTASELGRALGARRARIRLATQSEIATKELGGGKTEK